MIGVEQYRESSPLDQMHVMFYEHMARNPAAELKSVSRYLGLDDSFYDTYQFAIESRKATIRTDKTIPLSQVRDLSLLREVQKELKLQ